MRLEPPAPPTAPAPAVRPTPPTPPRIDKTPFARDEGQGTGDEGEVADAPQVNRRVDDPESMARDAVAHGSGALTRRTVERGDDNQTDRQPAPAPRQSSPPPAAEVPDTQSDYDRGQDVLREFRELDANPVQPTENPPAPLTEQSPPVVPRLNHHEGHGGFYWLFTIIFVAVAAFVFVKKFLLTDKPALTKSQLFDDSTDRLKAAADKVKPVAPPPKPAKLPPKKDGDKGKRFEVRI